MRKFRVYVKDKFDVVFDTIEKARDCRRALQQLKYEGIEIIISDEEVNPYNKIAGVDFKDSLDKLDGLGL